MSTQKLTLYAIPHRLRELEDRIIEADGVIEPEVEAELEALEDTFEHKAEYLALLAREAKAEAAATKLEEDRLKARRTAAENRERSIKDYLHYCLESAGVERVEGERIKVRIQQNSRPSIEWMGTEDEIPEAYKRVTVVADSQAAYESWKEGEELPEGFRVDLGSHVRTW